MIRQPWSWFLLLFLLLISSRAVSQQPITSDQEKARELRLQQDILKYEELEMKLLEEAFEAAVDPETYSVGPGDYFAVLLGGEVQKIFRLSVTAEGMLVIPTVGAIRVDEISLSDAKSRIRESVLRKYVEIDISTNLLKMRKIRVHVTGKISNPGTYVATPIDRVSDIIYRAGGLGIYAKHQELHIKHRNNDETIVDFSAYQQHGDLSQNPYVQGGDIIIVPPIEFSEQVVRVEGLVSRPGYYPIKANEGLLEFLNRYNLVVIHQKLDEIVIKSKEGNDLTIDMTGKASPETTLRGGDLITIPRVIREVYVMGAVQNPGRYAFVSNLQARDYVGQAGPNENAAGMNKVRVHHTNVGKSETGGNARVYLGDVIEVPIRTSRRLAEYLQVASIVATLAIAYTAVTR